MNALNREDEKEFCPYNNAHYILKSRMEYHLARCGSEYGENKPLVTCDFNVNHKIPPLELKYHHMNCPTRKEFEIQITLQETKPAEPTAAAPFDDFWDNCVASSYDPKKYCEENAVLRKIDTESASKRRHFQKSERQRIKSMKQYPDSLFKKPQELESSIQPKEV